MLLNRICTESEKVNVVTWPSMVTILGIHYGHTHTHRAKGIHCWGICALLKGLASNRGIECGESAS